MKKIILLTAILILIFAVNGWCGFNWGTDTYSIVGGQLIVNSTGDQTTSSTMGNLGTNDFIGELGVKNTLQYEGYTTAIDANNPTALAQCYSQYNQPLPNGGVGYTKLQFAGLNGDPRQLQNVYVLTSEYNRLSAQGQATSITNLNTGLSTETNRATTAEHNLHLDITGETANRVNGDTALQNNDLVLQSHISNEATNRMNADSAIQGSINNEANDRTNGDNALQSNINNANLNRINGDTNLQTNIDTETTRATGAETGLQGNIDTETTNRQQADQQEQTARITGDKKLQKNINKVNTNSINRDKKLQNNINTVDTNSKGRDTVLQTNIDNEAITRDNADTTLQNNITGETNRAVSSENILNNNIHTVNTNSIRRDNILLNDINTVDTNSQTRDNSLQSNINTEATTRGNADNTLQNNINGVDNKQTHWNTTQDNQISGLASTMSGQQDQLNNHDKRIHNLEKTQIGIRTQVNFIREKNYEMGVYGVYDISRSKASEVGLAITIGLGESYTDREISALNKKLEKMEAMFTNNVKRAGVTDVQVKTVKTDKGMKIMIDHEGTAKLLGRF